MNLAHWPLVYDFEAQRGGSCNCISWNLSAFEREMVAVGSNDQSVKIWEYNDASRKWAQVCNFLVLMIINFFDYRLKVYNVGGLTMLFMM